MVTQDQGQGVDKLVCLPFFLNPDADTLRRLRTVGYILVMYSSCIEVRWWISWSIHGLLSLLHFIVFVQTIGYYCQQQRLDAVYIFFFPYFLVIQPRKIIELWGHSGICYLPSATVPFHRKMQLPYSLLGFTISREKSFLGKREFPRIHNFKIHYWIIVVAVKVWAQFWV